MTDTRPPSLSRLLTGPALVEAVQPWLRLPDGEPLPEPVRPGARVGRSDVSRIQATTAAFRLLDNEHGGALSRLAVVGQLQHVTHLAATATYTEETGRALFAAIAELASVAGWMTHDAGVHDDAQRYLLLGLRAAHQAGSDGTGIGGHLLNCLARQANHLGHAHDALDLVQAAQYGTRKLPPGRLRALLASLEARCHAVLGDIGGMERATAAAEHALMGEGDDPAPSWAAWFDTAEFHVTAGVCEFIAAECVPARSARAIDLITQGTAHRPAERVRSRAFDHIALARAHVRAGQTDAADTATTTALALMGEVHSTRVSDRLRELDTELAAAPAGTAAAGSRGRIRAALRPS
ncbi:transcriptional regulator [Streptomyces lichenis]|uniref:Transcriptional regulator n=1 Tax=Streptomyces lichenis TaxID=2306967 RepID=A0ABT0I4B7_9ACTN|nr:transcriptional regulator [Streptomyces lichenis]MCK8676160.1 transcriptional regulator [Streptomyces lichenis]